MSLMSGFKRVAGRDEIPSLGRKSIIIDDDIPALLLRAGDDYYCVEDVCTHDGQPLTHGPFDGREITCPRHGARFEVATGRAVCMPATEPVQTFEVQVRQDGIYVRGAE
jgi:3-phenylpropionate/trans-cinnamate dioxygenase ferredoxin subunit